MDEEILLDTRARILRAALHEFAARGYHTTSVREIAERVGVTKTAVLYHFPGKADILGALAEPMLNDLDAAMVAADLTDPVEARWAAIEGLLEVWLTHRYLLRMSLHDLALAASGQVFERFRDAMMRANVLVARPDPDFAGRVRAVQVIAMLSDPVVLFADAPTEALRASVLHGVHRLLDGSESPSSAVDPDCTGDPSSPAARRGPMSSHGRRGRPSVMSPDMAETAQRMHSTGSTAGEIAAVLGVSRATVYRHIPTTD
ncbi:MAG: TetR family transcriptional regulator [Pseudonocardiaceae bacterium]